MYKNDRLGNLKVDVRVYPVYGVASDRSSSLMEVQEVPDLSSKVPRLAASQPDCNDTTKMEGMSGNHKHAESLFLAKCKIIVTIHQ